MNKKKGDERLFSSLMQPGGQVRLFFSTLSVSPSRPHLPKKQKLREWKVSLQESPCVLDSPNGYVERRKGGTMRQLAFQEKQTYRAAWLWVVEKVG